MKTPVLRVAAGMAASAAQAGPASSTGPLPVSTIQKTGGRAIPKTGTCGCASTLRHGLFAVFAKIPAVRIRTSHAFLTILCCAVAYGNEPESSIRMASGARLWIRVPAQHKPVETVETTIGSASRAEWENNPSVRDRLWDVTFPIQWWRWTENEIRFTPDYDGPLELVLSGTWSDNRSGGIFREEILWDRISAEGVDLKNGGFEQQRNALPSEWTSPWAAYPETRAWPLTSGKPLEGNHFAASWHNRPLQQVLLVRKGQPVAIRVHARAATPPDFKEPLVPAAKTPAHDAARRLRRGMNFGNGWEARPPWGLEFTAADVDRVADEGFDHVRIPVAFHRHFAEENGRLKLSPGLTAKLEPVLRRALERKLHVLLDWHHFDDLTKDPQANLERFVSGWDCIATHFRDWPEPLFFELLNEPNSALDTETAGPIYQKAIRAIRRTNPDRILVASPGHWGAAGELDKLRLPDGDWRIIVTIHCYEPFHFTHQGAGWVGLKELRGVVYPGPPDQPLQVPAALAKNGPLCAFLHRYNSRSGEHNPSSRKIIRDTLDLANDWSKRFGRPVHLGEFGAHNTGDDASRRRYLKDVRTIAEDRGIPWTLWEWKSSFGYWDPATGQPRFRKELID